MKARILLLAAVFAVSSCNLFKKSTKPDDDLVVMNLDTLEAFGTSAEPQVYRASETRLSDILHTKVDVSFDWSKQWMYGKATITAKPYFYPQSTLVLDARGMEIKEISLLKTETVITRGEVKQAAIKGKIYEPITTETKSTTKHPLKFVYEKDVITIELGRQYKNSEEYSIYIDYIAKPNELGKSGGSLAISDDKGLYFINPEGKEKDKPTEIWTQGETQATSVWMPTIDRPNERMTQEIYMTVDKKYVTLSNGELCDFSDNGDGTRTDHWKMELPHAPYLAMMAVGEFSVVKDKWRGKEVSYYVEKEYEPYARKIFGNTPEMLEYFSNKLGVEYPWNKYSQIVARDYVSGAMENTTATLHSEYLQRTDRELIDKDYEDYVSHELFHQWFGDLVTCESWSNLPLNESFATYGEYLWQEYKYGVDAADNHHAESRAQYFAEAERKQVNLIRFQYDDKEDMFDRHSYDKGGQILHMLRKYVGDDAFFAALKLYLETNKFTSVEVHQLRLAFEKTTGEDLNWFFNQWFLSSGHPDLVVRQEYDAANKKQKIQIRQVQDLQRTPLFKLPVYVDLYVNGKVNREKILITKADETFEFAADSKPDLVNVDAEKMLLCNLSESKPAQEWAYQYSHAPLFVDRSDALTQLTSLSQDSIATSVILKALEDKFWSIRMAAMDALKKVPAGHEKEIKDKLVNIAKNDKKSIARALATEYLYANYKDADLEELYRNGLKDKSYYVFSSSLSAIGKINPKDAMVIAKPYETEKNVDVLYAISELYSLNGTEEQNDFFVKTKDKFTGFSQIGFISQYTAFLKKDKKDEIVNGGVDLLAGIAKDPAGIKWVAYYAKKSVKEIQTMYEDKITFNEEKIKKLKEINPNSDVHVLQAEIEAAKVQRDKVAKVFGTL